MGESRKVFPPNDLNAQDIQNVPDLKTVPQHPRLERITKIIRWIRYGLLIVIVLLLAFIYQRFSLMQLPVAVGDFPAGSYILLDWKIQLGRKLIIGDWVFYQSVEKQPLKIGQVKGMSEDQQYIFILPLREEDILVQPIDKIRARMVMALFQTTEAVLPK